MTNLDYLVKATAYIAKKKKQREERFIKQALISGSALIAILIIITAII